MRVVNTSRIGTKGTAAIRSPRNKPTSKSRKSDGQTIADAPEDQGENPLPRASLTGASTGN